MVLQPKFVKVDICLK